MVTETTMNGRRARGHVIQKSAAGVRRNLTTLASELMTLAELQARLAILDMEESGRKSLLPAGIAVAGACLALGAVPVLLLAIAGFLNSTTGLSPETAAFIVASAGVFIGGGCIYWGYLAIRQACKCVHRSREEFRANLKWIQRAIHETTISPF